MVPRIFVDTGGFVDVHAHRLDVWGIFTYIWLVYGVNVGKYTIYWVCGMGLKWCTSLLIQVRFRKWYHEVGP